jgi:tRNA nucleotidyltransferase/poly(A) polymerase
LNLQRLKKSKILQAVHRLAGEGRAEVFLVGGAVRDLFLGRPPGKDFDFVLPGNVGGFAKEGARELGGTAFLLDDAFGTWRVVVKQEGGKSEVDFCALQGGNILADLRQRDFTVNSLAIRLADLFQRENPPVIDPLSGISDLRQGTLRVNSEASLRKDPLRMLRAYRFAYTLGLRIDEETGRAIGRNRKLIRLSAAERVRGEFFAPLHENRAAQFLGDLYRVGLLPELFPEIEAWAKLPLAPAPGFHLLEHALQTVTAGDFLLARLEDLVPPHGSSLERHFLQVIEDGISRKALFKFACFLHDSGKTETRPSGPENAPFRFLDHDQAGRRINERLAKRLKMSRRSQRILAELTRQHMRLAGLARNDALTPRAKYRFFRDLGKEGPDLVLLSLANAQGSGKNLSPVAPLGSPSGDLGRIMETGKELLRYFCEEFSSRPSGPLLNGKEVMQALGLGQTPLVGKVLGRLKEAEASGRVRSREEALEFIKNIDISAPFH